MKQPIRYFAIGLLTASLVLLIVVSFFDKPDTDVTDLPVEELTEVLQQKGYHVLSSAEYITLSMNSQPEATEKEDKKEKKDKEEKDEKEQDKKDKDQEKDKNKDQEKETDKKDDKKDDKQPEVHKYTLTIEPNMLGPTISKLLKEHKIIDDVDAFNRYLETEGYAGYLQLGDHKVSSDMSNYEIAEKIARKR